MSEFETNNDASWRKEEDEDEEEEEKEEEDEDEEEGEEAEEEALLTSGELSGMIAKLLPARFFVLKLVVMDQQTDRQTDRRTLPLVEMRGRI